jgi:hypothetical protein
LVIPLNALSASGICRRKSDPPVDSLSSLGRHGPMQEPGTAQTAWSACVLALTALTALALLSRLRGQPPSKAEVASAVVLLVGMALAVVSL